MKAWQDRFFRLNREHEVELVGSSPEKVIEVLENLGWGSETSAWYPDLEVTYFRKGEEEMFLVLETYFDPKLTGQDEEVREVQEALENSGS
ncbi:hypothetical protein SAMN02745181_1382 [Rubritalea squalenifaciens DSM 18772]|uniref:Uncharacterized protein n=1 Tax=Rubritalea squalenifaciens DSM 18772 TaxID=1123071 RepID=A0A1M6H6W4_9BACT|nr:hypothetical protein [Rubritalea squalenifaciens]SHJ17981.1 hypothetical protein SAMN02745181_1382 [Rubritalea squalenifaciens DSM 18772]